MSIKRDPEKIFVTYKTSFVNKQEINKLNTSKTYIISEHKKIIFRMRKVDNDKNLFIITETAFSRFPCK